MKNLTPYLAFEGNCKEALHFYKDCFDGAELKMQTYAEAPDDQCPPGAEKSHIMHAELNAGGLHFMACDYPKAEACMSDGRIGLAIDCNNVAEQETVFNRLAVNGQITMPLEDTFWGAKFGMVTDQFGICWMLNCEKSN